MGREGRERGGGKKGARCCEKKGFGGQDGDRGGGKSMKLETLRGW